MLRMIVKVNISIIINSGRIIFSVNTVQTQNTTDKKGENKRHFFNILMSVCQVSYEFRVFLFTLRVPQIVK